MTTEGPRAFQHALSLYNELLSRATPLDDDGTMRFEGSKVEAFRALGVSQTYYSVLYGALTELGCIEQIRRGQARVSSILLLHRPPGLQEFKAIYRGLLTKPSELDILRQQIEVLQRRVPSIDLNDFIMSLEQRLGGIEARLAHIERGRSSFASQTDTE